MEQADATFRSQNHRKAAILVMEPGSLWPGRSLDWAEHVGVVLQPATRNTDLTLRRVRRAAAARAVKLRSLECIVVTFADVAGPASFRGRSELVNGLGAVLLEVGCRRLVLAAYHAERLDLAELIALVNVPFPPGQLRIDVSFQRASNLRCRRVRARR